MQGCRLKYVKLHFKILVKKTTEIYAESITFLNVVNIFCSLYQVVVQHVHSWRHLIVIWVVFIHLINRKGEAGVNPFPHQEQSLGGFL